MKKRSFCGFSLIEIIVVLSILGIFTAFLAIKSYSIKSSISLKYSAKEIFSVLNRAKADAISKNEDIKIVFSENSYETGGKTTKLQKEIRITNPRTVIFSQSGNPKPGFFGTLSITNGKKTINIAISPMGRIKLE